MDRQLVCIDKILLNLKALFINFFWLCHMTCRICSLTRIKPLQWKHGVLTTGLPGKFPQLFLLPQMCAPLRTIVEPPASPPSNLCLYPNSSVSRTNPTCLPPFSPSPLPYCVLPTQQTVIYIFGM